MEDYPFKMLDRRQITIAKLLYLNDGSANWKFSNLQAGRQG